MDSRSVFSVVPTGKPPANPPPAHSRTVGGQFNKKILSDNILTDKENIITTLKNMWNKFIEIFFVRKSNINYNFNMKEYFTLDGKIEENRQRLREQYDMYRKTENYYPIFFIFIGFIGVYYFDFIDLLINNFSFKFSYIFFLITTIVTSVFLMLISFYIIRIVTLNKWNSDKLPKDTYHTYFNEISDWNKKQIEKGKESIDVEISVKEGYLDALENAVNENQITYKKKKDWIKKAIQLIIITMFIYSLNIIHYKQYSKMCEEEKPKTTVEVTNEGFIKVNPNTSIKEKIVEFFKSEREKNKPSLNRVKEIINKTSSTNKLTDEE